MNHPAQCACKHTELSREVPGTVMAEHSYPSVIFKLSLSHSQHLHLGLLSDGNGNPRGPQLESHLSIFDQHHEAANFISSSDDMSLASARPTRTGRAQGCPSHKGLSPPGLDARRRAGLTRLHRRRRPLAARQRQQRVQPGARQLHHLHRPLARLVHQDGRYPVPRPQT